MPTKTVYVEMKNGFPYRIVNNRRGPTDTIEISKQDAVYAIRRQVFDRANESCERCGTPITWSTGHLHEVKNRGRGGEVSVENCIALCPKCHLGKDGVHADHYPAWSKK